MTPHLHTDKAGYDDGAQDTNAATSHTNGTNHQFMKLFKQRPIETWTQHTLQTHLIFKYIEAYKRIH